MNLSDLYRQVILDHAQHPRNFGALPDGLKVELHNPTCGDEITLFLTLKDGVVEKVSFQGSGCSISMSSASMLTDAIQGRPVEEVLHLNREFRKLLQGQEAEGELLGDLEALSGVTAFPARIKCAVLAWNALEQGVRSQKGEGDADE
ncbi:MAG TPA: SUF system NifU family Fe-S cluster assembly protein [Bacilli bacterium]|nr:SUF system NifU family Fe-S cluster assembly protein [Bacilli bacterium]